MNKINVQKYIIYSFSMVIGFMLVIHYQTKQKRKNNITCSITKSFSFSYGNGFVLKWKDYYAFVTQKVKKTHFLNEFSTKKLKNWNGHNSIFVYQYHSPKTNSTNDFSFELDICNKFKTLW